VDEGRPLDPSDLQRDLERLRAMIDGVKTFATQVRARHPELREGVSIDAMSWPRRIGDASGRWSAAAEALGLNPMLTPEGHSILTSVLDVVERNRGEEERSRLLGQLRTLNAELEERVEARTAQLQASLKENEVLLQEIHHRVKNNLQVISSLISMQARSLGPDGSRDALEECQMRVQAIALIHDQLYQSKDCARVPFAEYARALIGNVFKVTDVRPERVRLELAIHDVTLAVDRAIPCGLILNELITNALKHAFPQGRSGTVRVELNRVGEGTLLLEVKDDGAGLPPGFDVYQSPSLGLQLVCMLAEQVQAAIDVERAAGTCFRLTLPMAS